MRRGEAPSAVRTAISRWRAAALRQAEVGDVGTGDQEHERHRRKQNQQSTPDAGGSCLLKRDDRDVLIPVSGHAPRKECPDSGLEYTHLGMPLRERGAGAQAADHGHEVSRPIGARVSRIEAERHP